MDHDLKWTSQVNKTVSKLRSLTFALRYLRRHLSLSEMKPILFAHVVSHLCYGAPVWNHSLNYRQKAQLRSVFFKILRIVVRDFGFKMNRTQLPQACEMEHIDKILFKRESMFLFNLIHNMAPTELVGKLMQRAYSNDRNAGKLHFFYFSKSKTGRACISNNAQKIASRWNFDCFFLTPPSFKLKLSQQLKEENKIFKFKFNF